MEIRAEAGDAPSIYGFIPYNSPSLNMGYTEIIKPGAFTRSIERNNIQSFWSHQTSKPLGNTKAGTMVLRDAPEGLHVRITPPATTWGLDAVESIRRGDTTGFSFGFTVKKENWPARDTKELLEVNLFEVSPTPLAAYPDSMATVRNQVQGVKEQMPDEIQTTLIEIRDALMGLKLPGDKPLTGLDDGPVLEGENRAFHNLGEMAQAVMKAHTPGGEVDARLVRAATGMGEVIDSEGGFLVQTEENASLLTSVNKTALVAPRCTRFTLGANVNGIKFPALDESSRVDGSRGGGVLAYWADEAETVTATKPKFRQIKMDLLKLMALAYVTDELLADARALGQYLEIFFGAEIAFQLDNGIINGTGSGQPLGILNSPATIAVDAEGGQTADTVVWENIKSMWTRLYPMGRSRAAWFINQEIETQLWAMYQTAGDNAVPVYLPAGGASGSPYSTLMGRPVIPAEQCAALGDKGDIILADMSQYALIDKGGIQSDSSIHVRFAYGEKAFRFTYRCNGQPTWNGPLTPYKGSNTVSPFITLAAR